MATRGGLRPTSAQRVVESFEAGGEGPVRGRNPFKADHSQHLQELRQKSGAPGATAAPGPPASRRAKTPPALSQLREREREHLVLQSLERLEHKHTAERAVRDLTEVIENASLEELRKFLRVAFDSKRPLVASKARQQLLLLLRSVVRRFHTLNAGSDAAKALKERVLLFAATGFWFPPSGMILLAIGFVLLLVPCLWLFAITFFPAKTDSIAGKNCAVTGASEGLGAVIALHLAQVGVKKMLLGARRMEKLEKVKADVLKQVPTAEVILVKLDVRDADSRKNFAAVARENGCNLLVNNAGVDRNAFFENMTDDIVDQMLETNLSCCVKLTRDFVKFMLEDWEGKRDDADSGANTDVLMPQVLEAAATAGVYVSFHIEPYGGRTPETFLEDLKYIFREYGKHPAIFREGPQERPIFWLYDVSAQHSLSEVAQWRAVLDAVRGTELDAIFLCLWIGTGGGREDLRFLTEGGFDGAYTYFAAEGFTPGSNTKSWQDVSERLKKIGKIFVPSVGPGYDDTRIRPWNKHNIRLRKDGASYDRMWSAALRSRPHAISVTSYNEWGEGTQIEPAMKHRSAKGEFYPSYSPQEHTYYLDITRYWSRTFKEGQCRDSVAKNEL